MLQEVKEEIQALLISENESLTVEKRRVWHRGNQIKRKDIPETLLALREEEKQLNNELAKHDTLCRTLHYKAAETIDKSWSKQLKLLTGLVHYSEHAISNIKDAANKFNNVLSIALADGRVSSSELVDILNISNDYYNSVRRVYKHSGTLSLDPKLLENMKVESYQSAFEEFKLEPPAKENIDEWVNVIGGWASVALSALQKLRNEALELLLNTEEDVKEAYVNNKSLLPIVNTISLPEEYDILTPGKERDIQRKLGVWDRFFTGDGLVPSIAKFTIAAGILFAAIFYGNYSQKLPFYVYNGLQTNVTVLVDGQSLELGANKSESIQLSYGQEYHVKTLYNDNSIIEELDVSFNEHSAFVYNVANSAVFVKYLIYYGATSIVGSNYDSQTTMLGAKKWFPVDADYILEEAPSTISLSSGSNGETRDVIEAYSNESPDRLLSTIDDENIKEKIIKSRSLWDNGKSKNITEWLYYLNNVEDGKKIVESRLFRNPKELISLRAIQELSDSLSHKTVCEKHMKLANDNPDDADYYYISTRCIEDEDLKNEKFIAGHEKWKNHDWLAFASAYVYSENEEWEKSYNSYKVAAKNNKNLAEVVAMDAERIKRYLNELKNTENYTTIVNNDDIKYYKELENGNIEGGKENVNYVYYLMQKGELQKAFDLAEKFEESSAYNMRLIGASTNATKEMQEKALSFSNEEGVNINSAWSVLGLKVKNKKDYKMTLSTFNSLELESEYLETLINLIKSNQINAVDQHIKELNLRWKAQIYTMASIIRSGDIPKRWKQKAKILLFANEKPFIE